MSYTIVSEFSIGALHADDVHSGTSATANGRDHVGRVRALVTRAAGGLRALGLRQAVTRRNHSNNGTNGRSPTRDRICGGITFPIYRRTRSAGGVHHGHSESKISSTRTPSSWPRCSRRRPIFRPAKGDRFRPTGTS